jgi:8-oxo-dGTP pyrophosphatase MutT (NUDIX family)
MSLDALTVSEIAHRLAQAAGRPVAREEVLYGRGEAPRPAAVLLPLFRREGRWRLLYIRRAVSAADRHSGEVAFPGGHIEASDPHPTGAALREAQEEVGLAAVQVQVLGRLPTLLTATNYLVTPVVGLVPWPLALRPDPAEVARIFSLSLHWLAQPGHHELRPWLPQGHSRPRQVVFFQEHHGERLWGVSARITLTLLQSLGAWD